MGVEWGSPSSSLRRPHGARLADGCRRLFANPSRRSDLRRDRASMVFSEWRGVLDALAQLHKIAPPGYGLPVDASVGATGGALTSGRDAVAPPSRLAPHASRPVQSTKEGGEG